MDFDPLSRIINTDVGETFYWEREPDRAILALQRALELDPNFAQVHVVLGKVYEQQRNFDRALADFKRAGDLSDDAPSSLAYQALNLVTQLNEQSKQRYVPDVSFAFIDCALGDNGRAITRLEK